LGQKHAICNGKDSVGVNGRIGIDANARQTVRYLENQLNRWAELPLVAR
jgi:hypothetical protein